MVVMNTRVRDIQKLLKQSNLKPTPPWGGARAVGRHGLWGYNYGFKSHLKHIQQCELKHTSAFMQKMRVLYKCDNEEKAPSIPSGT